MAYKLTKPFTAEERANFITTHQGMAFLEDDNAIYFLEPYETFQNGIVRDVSETDAYKNEMGRKAHANICMQIVVLEGQSLMPRPLRDIILKDPTNAAYTKVKALDDQIATLRAQLTKE